MAGKRGSKKPADSTHNKKEAAKSRAALIDELEALKTENALLKESNERNIRAEEALRESEIRFHTAVKNSNFVLSQFDRDLKYTWIHNPHPDFDASFMIGKTGDELEDSKGMRQLTAVKRQVVESGKGIREEISFGRSDGVHTYDTTVEPLFDGAGAVIGGFVSALDITERKRTEKTLRETRDYLESLINYANAPIIVWNPAFTVTQFNHAFEWLSGYKAEEIIGENLKMLFPPGSVDESMEKIRVTLFGERWESVEIPILRKDGSVRIALWNSANVQDEKGELLATIAQGQDITGRKRAEEALRESEELFRNVFEHSALGMAIGDVEGHVVESNPALENMLGYSMDELRNKPFSEFTHPDDVAKEWPLIEKLKAGEIDHYDIEKRYIRKDGRTILVRLMGGLIVDSCGKPKTGIALVEDITERKRAEEALQEGMETSRRRAEELEKLMDMVPAAVWVSQDPECRVITGNRAANRFYEAGPDENVSAGPRTGEQNMARRFFRDGRELKPEELPMQEAAARGVDVLNAELEVLRPSGRRMSILGNASPLLDADSNVRGCIGTFMDITERKRAEDERKKVLETLSQSENQLRALVFNLESGVTLIDEAGRFVIVNPAFLKMFGLADESDIMNINSQDWSRWEVYDEDGKLLHVDDHPVRRAAMTGRPEKGRLVAMRNPGTKELKWMLISAEPLRREDGSVYRVVCTYHNITEHKRAEDALAAAHRQFQSIIDNTPDIVYVFDLEERFVLVNTALARLFNSTPDQMFGKRRHEFMPREDADWHEANDRKAIEAGRALEFEEYSQLKGRSITWLTKKFPLRDARGSIYAVAGISADISERKRAEEELLAAKMQAELYLDLMGHDIGNMHQIAMAQLELANEAFDDEGGLKSEEKELIKTPLEVLNRSAKLIDNVRNLQKLKAGEFKDECLDLNNLLSSIVKEYEFMVPASSIKFVENGPRHVIANRLLHDVFVNIISNAIKHSNGNGVDINIRVENACENGKNYYKVLVEDTGPGIPDVMKDKVFNRLRRGDTKARGLGLGLYLVKSLVECYHGRVWAEDRIVGDHTKGSRFVVLLPALEDSNVN